MEWVALLRRTCLSEKKSNDNPRGRGGKTASTTHRQENRFHLFEEEGGSLLLLEVRGSKEMFVCRSLGFLTGGAVFHLNQ